MARALASAGCNIVPIARRLEKLEEVAAAIRADFGVEVLPLRCDITSTEQVEDVVAKALERFGRIDVLVNNAGTGAVAPAEEITDAQFENEFQIDLFGSFKVAREVAKRAMLPAKYGRIINISSNAGRMGGYANSQSYTASKGGVIAITKGIARQLAPRNITVNVVCPGTTETEMSKTYDEETRKRLVGRIPLGRLGKPEDTAAAVCFFASEEAGFITGAVLDVNGGMYM